MKIKIPLLLAFCLFSLSLFAQNSYSIKGAAIDTDLRVKLGNTSISVLNAKDSILVKFTLANEEGAFAINDLPAGKFQVLISYPEYADYVESFTLDAEHPTHDFGNINLRLKEKILKEVLIKGEVKAIKIKGDTTEFNARAYVTQPNAKVEDLLKQLPGIQIDKDGKITANGESVPKVLVDGEEFFGDDPTLVTKNIRADMVDKVQLYDKKSDQASFTGIDDGQKTKTINIILKEDKKNGAFGKISGGSGTDGYYEGQVIYNKFKAKNKFSVYGTMANDGKTGLGFEDNSKLGTSGGNVQVGDDGGISIYFNSNGDDLDSFDGTYNGKGLPLARTGGVHYDGKLNNDKTTINLNYKIGSIQVDGVTSTQSQQVVPTALSTNPNLPPTPSQIIGNNSGETFNNYAFRHKGDVTYTVKIDTSTTLKLSADGTVKTFRVNNVYQTSSNNNDTLVNRSNRNITNNGTQEIFNASALFTKKFKKPRRTFSWNISEAYNNNDTKGYLVSEIDYFNKTGGLDSVQKTNQYKTINSVSSVFNSNITYSEPLSRYLSILFNYGFATNNSNSDKKSFDQSTPGVYNILDNTYSNSYQFNQLTNQVGAVFNYKRGKSTVAFGSKASDVNFKQIDEMTGIVYKRDFVNWAPQVNFQYKFAQQKTFSFNYNGSNTQPSIEQIQPVKVNTDPLNITLGNPNLKSSFNNRINAYYNSYQVISGGSVYVSGNYSFTTNPIVNNTTTDYTTDKTTIQYVNLGNKTPYNYSVYSSFGRKIKPIDVTVSLDLSTYGNVSYSYINGALNQSKTQTYSPQIGLQTYSEKKYDFYFEGGPTYTINEFSLQPQSNNNAPGFNLNAQGSVYLPLKLQLASDMRYLYSAKTQQLDANQRIIMNASLNKTFFKGDNLKLSLAVNNLFNQDVNFNRSVSANTITQTTSTSIRRYFMFSVSWDFTKFATSPAPASTPSKN